MKAIEINSFEDIQHLQEKHGLDFTDSISAFAINLLNVYHSQEHEIAILYFDPEVLPKSYRNFPGMWVNFLKEKVNNACQYAHLTGFTEAETIVLRASAQPYEATFIKRLIGSLQHCKPGEWHTMRTKDISFNYQVRPHDLLTRLRKKGFPDITSVRTPKITKFKPYP